MNLGKALLSAARDVLGTEMYLDAACLSNVGKRRSRNEDNFVFDGRCMPLQHGSLDAPLVLREPLCSGERVAVFDGMGGGDHGEEASFVAASLLTGEPSGYLEPGDDVESYLVRLCRRMNQCVNTRQLENMCRQMGSTAAIVYFWDGEAYICNVGDSPVFFMRAGMLEKVSTDHTDRELLESCGITDRKPGLTQFLGMDPEEYVVTPSIVRYELERGDTLLLCSDGVTDLIAPREIEAAFCREESAAGRVQYLVDEALRRGGVDNITAIVCNIC